MTTQRLDAEDIALLALTALLVGPITGLMLAHGVTAYKAGRKWRGGAWIAAAALYGATLGYLSFLLLDSMWYHGIAP
jgi:hypothetical protein